MHTSDDGQDKRQVQTCPGFGVGIRKSPVLMRFVAELYMLAQDHRWHTRKGGAPIWAKQFTKNFFQFKNFLPQSFAFVSI